MNRFKITGLRRGVPMLAILLLSGCSSLSYYTQLASGQLALLRAREPVSDVIADPQRDPKLRDRLLKSQQARAFASQQLHLPDNQSYRLFADIHRPYVVWNVFATGEFSLDPVTHCFPIAGCVAYRGYYDQNAARGSGVAEARRQGRVCQRCRGVLHTGLVQRPDHQFDDELG